MHIEREGGGGGGSLHVVTSLHIGLEFWRFVCPGAGGVYTRGAVDRPLVVVMIVHCHTIRLIVPCSVW